MKELNPQQRLAAMHIEGPLLVLAGAGSGKTGVVTHRIAHLIDIGVPAGEIVALTFTNKAAEEMRNRVQDMANQYVLTSTFHSLGARILREAIDHLGYKSDFTIYDEHDSETLVKTCLKSLGFKEEKSLVKQGRAAISGAKNDLISPEQFDGEFSELYSLYQRRLKEYNALDFDDLLYLTVQLFQTNKDVLEHYQNRWRFILIDEYQDTNKAQYLLTKSLCEKHNNIFAVGDPDQSIYSWRGAHVGNILNFEKDFEDAKVITLEQNYRSTETILKAANHLIEHNEGRYEKNLWSTLGQGDPIGAYVARSEHEEAQFVIENVKRLYIPLSDCVIFYRTNAQSRPFEDALLREQMPYVIIGGISFYQRREIKDMVALLRMVVSETDFLSFARTINLPKRGIGAATIAKMRTACEERGLSIKQLSSEIQLSKKQQAGLEDYMRTIRQLEEMVRSNVPIDTVIAAAIKHSGYLDYLKEDPETYLDRKANLDELIAKGTEWQEERDNPSLVAFLEELSLKSSLDQKPIGDALKLMTLHNGKGLEFEAVFLVGMEEDLLPHVNSKDSSEALEEERRLCYVGMTRAKKRLFLSRSTYRVVWGTPRIMQASRFLEEIPPEYILSYNEDEVYEEPSEAFLEGTTVFHKDFGKGVVQDNYQTSLGLTYDVYFHDEGITRSLVAEYAKLKRH